MQRVGVLLLLGGAVLFATWIAAPASSAPQAGGDGPSAVAVAVSTLDELNDELDRLHGRLDEVSAYTPPARDPFNFDSGARRRDGATADRAVDELPHEPVVVPRLVAVIAGTPCEDGTVRHRAVFPDGDTVQIREAGERIGSLLIHEVNRERVVLFDPVSGTVFTATLH